jgi:oxaloacetate decarboxylase alpha subunit
MNDAESNIVCARMVKEGGGDYVIAALVFTLSPIHDDAYYAERARRLAASPGHRRAVHQGPGGLLSPRAQHADPGDAAQLRREAARAAFPLARSASPSSLTWMRPIIGVSALQCARRCRGRHLESPVGANVSNLRALGHSVRIDDEAWPRSDATSRAWRRPKALPVGRPQGFDASYLHHQLPGGMVGHHAAPSGRASRLASRGAVIEELGRVRQELGWPIVMTPFSPDRADARPS